MRVQVSDPAFTYDLLYSLRREGYSAAQVTGNTLEVRIPHGACSEKTQLRLRYYLVSWRARHAGVVADLVEPARRRADGNGERPRPLGPREQR